MAITIRLNGDSHPLTAPLAVEALLRELGLDPRMVAVERNRDVVKRADYGRVEITDGDEIEIVAFVGGG